MIRDLHREAFEGGRIRVISGKAEDVAESAGEGVADLVITAEAVHWFDRGDGLRGWGRC